MRNSLDQEESRLLSPQASLSRDALRRRPDKTADQDHRQNYAIDVDRILHSLAYTRYIDKTQVFYLIKDDHITHRVLHVQLVSRIARTVGRYLRLNLDLIEAIALGHDLGHAPFGHDGEIYLSRLCRAHGIGHFLHEVQSIEFLENIERKGQGLNLSLQVLDGILAHNGEVDIGSLDPGPKLSFEEFDRRMKSKIENPSVDFMPMNFEGCVVRLADTISYIGRDIEDAIRLGIVRRTDLPPDCVRVLGNTNGKIVYALVTDLIQTSLKKGRVTFSSGITEALIKLKNFNRERIYYNQNIKKEGEKIENLFKLLFERLLEDFETGAQNSPRFREHLENMAPDYLDTRPPAAVVRDFIAGMTDEYFLSEARRMLLPRYQDRRF